MGYNKILIPLDGSELAELALRHLPNVARPRSHIHLLSVFPVEEPLVALAAIASAVGPDLSRNLPSPSDEIRERKEYLEKVAKKLEDMDYEVTFNVPSGHVAETIASISQDGFELVLMATHGRTGFSKFVLGSVSENVLHRAHCPVLIV